MEKLEKLFDLYASKPHNEWLNQLSGEQKRVILILMEEARSDGYSDGYDSGYDTGVNY
jgi:hypothetical protein